MKATRCQCGAVTVELEGESYSMPLKEYRRLFAGQLVPQKTACNCNYCVNHWGIDLCGCGSGHKFGRCGNRLSECGRRAQDMFLKVTGCTLDKGGWGR
jgi:hypothetical protein